MSFLCFSSLVLAQTTTKEELSAIISTVNSFTESQSVEKLYIQTDKPCYFSGDTLWFKAYLFNASYLKASDKSGVMYLEIANDSNRVVKRIMLPVLEGLTYGQVRLDEKEFVQGSYVLRAYTNWMRNYGEAYIFEKPFYIGHTEANDWLINYNARIVKENGKDKMQLRLLLKQFDQAPIGFRGLQVRLGDDKRTWLNSNEETNSEGLLNVNLDLPEKLNEKNISLTLQDKRKGGDKRTLWVPVSLNRPDHMDFQFMPEGGDLVAGLPARVAFKALNEDGKSADVSGKIYNSKSQEVCRFSSSHKGMGSFDFVPEPRESYIAWVNLPDGNHKTYPLPAVKASGISLRIDNPFGSDSCEVTIKATPEIVALTKKYFLVAQARGIACYGSAFNLNKRIARFKVANNLFPTGIVRFTLIGPDKSALNERIIFIDHADNLAIHTAFIKTSYTPRDSVSLQIKVADKQGLPVRGSFSIAITDDSQVQTDSLSNYSIVNQTILASELKGTIEAPGYYMQATKNAEVWRDLDHLLLSQGWTGFDWDDIFKLPTNPQFAAEPEFSVKGKVTNAFNKPVPASGVSLLSRKPFILQQAVTDSLGKFSFQGLFPVDTAVFFIQAKNRKNKSFNVGIEVEEFVPPVFTAPQHRLQPWYVNVDTTNLGRLTKRVSMENKIAKLTGSTLKEVVIKSKKIITGSKNLNGPGEADITITQQELEKAGRTSLGDLMEKNVKGFVLRGTKSGAQYYFINSQMLHLIIDGIDTEFSWDGQTPLYQHFKYFFDYYDAEEIKGIEVMVNKTMRYTSQFLDPMSIPWDHAFIEVTTRGGKGPFLKKAVGTYLYKPIPFSMPRKFYVPRYREGSIADMTDIRSTIYWNPDVVTNQQGIAVVSFYTADVPGKYSILIEGSDMQGNLGTKSEKIVVK